MGLRLPGRWRAATLGRMHIRWKPRARTERGKPTTHWAAILLRSVRIDGKPRHEYVTYLAGITKLDIKSVEHRVAFWNDALSKLDTHRDEISSEQRRKIEAALAARVPRPNSKEMQRHTRALQPSADEQFDREMEYEEALERGL